MRSMTGFGSATSDGPAGSVSCEIRTVNHRHLKVSLRAPTALAGREPEFEARIRESLARGAVQASVRVVRGAEVRTPLVDTDRAREYAGALADLAATVGLPGEPDLAMIAALPGVILSGPPAEEESGELMATALDALGRALEDLDASRGREGKALHKDFRSRGARVEKALAKVRKRAPRMVAAARRRLEKRLEEVLADHPGAANRDAVTREIVLLAERSDVSEEITRLQTHLGAFRKATDGGGEIGRRLDFLLQEMLREVNTIGSKAQDATITAAVVDMKVEVDRMKEQAANVE